MAKKKVITATYGELRADRLDGSINDAGVLLASILNEAIGRGFQNVRLVDNTAIDSPTEWNIVGERLETDKELASRVECEQMSKQSRQKQKEEELKQLEKLAKKNEMRLVPDTEGR